jgi:hypothetical protein
MEKKSSIQSTPFHDKSSSKTRNWRNLSQLNKGYIGKKNYSQHHAQWKDKGTHSPLLFNIDLEFLIRGIPRRNSKKTRRGIKRIKIDVEQVKLSLFTADMVLYLKTQKLPPKTPGYHKQLKQSKRLKYQFRKMSSMSIHKQ